LEISTNLAPANARIFLQWVPHGFGYKSLNIIFVLWVAWRVLVKKNKLWLMVHEPFLEFGGSFRVKFAALVHRGMIWILLYLTSRAFASNRKWIEKISKWKPRNLFIEILPVPSTILGMRRLEKIWFPRCDDLVVWEEKPIGHLGTFGHNTIRYLQKIIPIILRKNKRSSFLLIGKGSCEFRMRLLLNCPELADKVEATGLLENDDMVKRVADCSVMLQVCEGGISFRNTSVMAALSLAKPLVANSGQFTEVEWFQWPSVNLCRDDDFDGLIGSVNNLLGNPKDALRKGLKNLEIYQEYFSKERLIDVLKRDNDR
jgi:hypothetical protein